MWKFVNESTFSRSWPMIMSENIVIITYLQIITEFDQFLTFLIKSWQPKWTELVWMNDELENKEIKIFFLLTSRLRASQLPWQSPTIFDKNGPSEISSLPNCNWKIFTHVILLSCFHSQIQIYPVYGIRMHRSIRMFLKQWYKKRQ